MNRRNPLLTPEYWRALHAFHKKHPGAIPPVAGSKQDVRKEAAKKKAAFNLKLRENAAGRKDGSAPVAPRGGYPKRGSDERGNTSGVGRERPSGNSPSDGDGATMSRAPEALSKTVREDRQGPNLQTLHIQDSKPVRENSHLDPNSRADFDPCRSSE